MRDQVRYWHPRRSTPSPPPVESLVGQTVAGSAVTSGRSGFNIDVAGLAAGNTINIDYTDTATNTLRHLTIVRSTIECFAAFQQRHAESNDRVIGTISGGLASVVAQLNTALGPTGLQVFNPAGTALQVLDDGAGNKVNVNSLQRRKP